MNPKIKICGLTTKEQIEMINRYPIDYVGFVFAPSKRQVTMYEAKVLRQFLHQQIKAVGVFMDLPIKEVNKIASYCRLDIVQLHGKETPDDCRQIQFPMWKVIAMEKEASIKQIELYKMVDGFVFDSVKGGSGKTFCWNWIKHISNEYMKVLAGGLNIENVQEAIETVIPQVVDVSSGVETNGKKDPKKIEEFIRKVKGYGM